LLTLLPAQLAVNPPSCAETGLNETAYRLTVDGSNLIREGKPSQALVKLMEAQALKPDSWDAAYDIAYAYEQLGKTSEALEWYRKADKADPSRYQGLLGVARVYYTQKDYKDALPIMEQFAAQHPATDKTYAGYLALARCYAETGKVKEFCDTVDKAFSVQSNDPAGWRFAGQEMDYLGHYEEAMKYYKEYLKRFPDQPDFAQISERLNIVSFQKQQAKKLKEAKDCFNLDADTEDLREFVVRLAPSGRRVSNTSFAQLMLGLSEIPRSYRHQLEINNYKVVVAPTVIDAMPELAGQRPRGFFDGASWHNTNGTFDYRTGRIIIGEKYAAADQGGKIVDGPLDETIQHEFGHAYDFYLGVKKFGRTTLNPHPEISHSQWFAESYYQDVRNIPDNLRAKLYYYLQPGDAGKEELFAEMFVLFFGKQPEPGSPQEYFKVAFPRVLQRLIDARRIDPDYERYHNLYDAKLKENTLTPSERVQEILKQ